MTPSALTAPLSPATYATERTPLHDELFVRATIADAFADLRDTWEPAATKAATWADYEWPAWVPEKVREQIEGFWSESWGRGPAAWEFSAKQNGAPAMGEVVTLRDGFGNNASRATGRFVFAWNNIARLVMDDGTFRYTSFHPGDFAEPAAICGTCEAAGGEPCRTRSGRVAKAWHRGRRG